VKELILNLLWPIGGALIILFFWWLAGPLPVFERGPELVSFVLIMVAGALAGWVVGMAVDP
jgi:hypothetical protein